MAFWNSYLAENNGKRPVTDQRKWLGLCHFYHSILKDFSFCCSQTDFNKAKDYYIIWVPVFLSRNLSQFH